MQDYVFSPSLGDCKLREDRMMILSPLFLASSTGPVPDTEWMLNEPLPHRVVEQRPGPLLIK